MKTFNLWPAQAKFVEVCKDADYDIVYYQGGVGSGKSFAAALKGFNQIQFFPDWDGMVIGATKQAMMATVANSWREVMAGTGLVEGLDFKFHGDDFIQFYDEVGNRRNRVYFRTVDRPDKWRSMQVHWVNVEEASVCLTRRAWMELLTRCRQGTRPWSIFMQSNPEEYAGVLAEIFDDEKLGRHTNDGFTTLIRKLKASTDENKALSPAYRAMLRSTMDDTTYRRMVDGEYFVDTSKLINYNFTDANIDHTLAYNPKLPLHLTCDFNVDPMCWLVMQRGAEGTFNFIDELCIENTQTREAAGAFHAKWGDLHRRKPLFINGDPSGGNRSTQAEGSNAPGMMHDDSSPKWSGNWLILRKELERLGWQNVVLDVRTGHRQITERISTWLAHIKNKDGRIRIRMHPDCKQLIYNMRTLKYVEGGGKKIIDLPSVSAILRDKQLKYLGHPFDAASYAVEFYSPIDRTAIMSKSKTYKEYPR
jgi:hypothetical protein